MANNLITELEGVRHRLGSFSKLATKLGMSPQEVRETLVGIRPVRWKMACAIVARLPALMPELLRYMRDHWDEESARREEERNGDDD